MALRREPGTSVCGALHSGELDAAPLCDVLRASLVCDSFTKMSMALEMIECAPAPRRSHPTALRVGASLGPRPKARETRRVRTLGALLMGRPLLSAPLASMRARAPSRHTGT